MIDPGKLTALVIVLVGFYFVISDYRSHREMRFIYNAYAFLAVGLVFSILKDVYEYYNYFFNIFEHSFGIMLAGFLFGAGAYLANRRMNKVIDEGRKMRAGKIKEMREKQEVKEMKEKQEVKEVKEKQEVKEVKEKQEVKEVKETKEVKKKKEVKKTNEINEISKKEVRSK